MNGENLANSKLGLVLGSVKEEYYNTCKVCGKKWDMRKYGYGQESMPNWVTGPWCPECRKDQQKSSPTQSKQCL